MTSPASLTRPTSLPDVAEARETTARRRHETSDMPLRGDEICLEWSSTRRRDLELREGFWTTAVSTIHASQQVMEAQLAETPERSDGWIAEDLGVKFDTVQTTAREMVREHESVAGKRSPRMAKNGATPGGVRSLWRACT